VPIPTACVLVEVFVGLRHRLHWAMLFDYVFVSHPGFVRTFQAAGHPNVYCLPLAAPDSYLGTPGDDTIRHFDVGWVGRSEGPLFTARARIFPRVFTVQLRAVAVCLKHFYLSDFDVALRKIGPLYSGR